VHSLKTYAHVYVNVGQAVMDMYTTMQSCAGTYVQSQHCPCYHNLIVTLFLYLHLYHFVRCNFVTFSVTWYSIHQCVHPLPTNEVVISIIVTPLHAEGFEHLYWDCYT